MWSNASCSLADAATSGKKPSPWGRPQTPVKMALKVNPKLWSHSSTVGGGNAPLHVVVSTTLERWPWKFFTGCLQQKNRDALCKFRVSFDILLWILVHLKRCTSVQLQDTRTSSKSALASLTSDRVTSHRFPVNNLWLMLFIRIVLYLFGTSST